MINLHLWSDDDLNILHLTVGDPQIMQHLGGIESSEKILQRHQRYLKRVTPDKGEMFTIWLEPDSKIVGTTRFWEKTWKEELIYETGWMVLPAYAGRGIATKAARAVVALAARHHKHRFLHAFPSVVNIASNGVCNRAGFANLGECTFEYPKGQFMLCNDWRIDLFKINGMVPTQEPVAPGWR